MSASGKEKHYKGLAGFMEIIRWYFDFAPEDKGLIVSIDDGIALVGNQLFISTDRWEIHERQTGKATAVFNGVVTAPFHGSTLEAFEFRDFYLTAKNNLPVAYGIA